MRCVECQATTPKASSHYASGPNDVWSLGVILVNLTCGRNPWKRASTADATFRAYLQDPHFLSSILPLSPELDRILRRIFECNPAQRITIPELRQLILRCPRFTLRPRLPTPDERDFPPAFTPHAVAGYHNHHHHHPPHSPPETPAPSSPAPIISSHRSNATTASSGSSSDDGSVYSTASSASSVSDVDPLPPYKAHGTIGMPAPGNFYGNLFPSLDWAAKPPTYQPYMAPVPVY